MADKGRIDGIVVRGFIVRSGGKLRKFEDRERIAATHLISGFQYDMGVDGSQTGTVVWFKGNNRGDKLSGMGGELGPGFFGTAPRGFWVRLDDDLKGSMRIDRQKAFIEGERRFHVYALQVDADTIASILVREGVPIAPTAVRAAITLSLDETKNVMIDPTDAAKSHMHFRP